MADGVWKSVYCIVFGRSRQLSLDKFLDPSTPFMKKVDNGEKKEEKIMLFIMATNVITSQQPECRPTGTPTARAKSC